MTKKILIIAVIVTVCCTACRLVGVTVTYNMTGGSLDPAIKTFSAVYADIVFNYLFVGTWY